MSGETDRNSGDPVERDVQISGPGAVTISNGASATLQFTVRETRIAQAIHLAVTGLPPGVTATFTPASIAHPTASQNVSLQLSAAASALEALATIQVTASTPGLSDSQPVSLTLTSPFSSVPGAPVLPIGATGESTVTVGPVKLAPFGQVSFPVNLQVANGLAGTITFSVISGLPSGVTAQFAPSSLTVNAGGGSYAVSLMLKAAGSVVPAITSVTAAVKVGGVEHGKIACALTIVAPFVSGISPSAGSVPVFQRPGTSVTIRGGGFGPGTTVAFGTGSAVSATSVAPDGTSLVVHVPATATTGALTVTSPAGAAAGPSFVVDNYRNTRGYSWMNNDLFQQLVTPMYSFADATALFGAAQTDFDFFGANLLAPFVELFLGACDLALGDNGQCFGMALTSLRFVTGQLNVRTFPQQPAGAEPGGPAGPDVWTLNGPPLGLGTNVSPALSALVHSQHMAQFSQESIDWWLAFHASVTSAAGLRTAIVQAFTAGGQNGVGALVAMSPSVGKGHVVVAFDVVDTGGGNFDILVYNPNSPFVSNEDHDPVDHAGRMSGSVIHVMNDGRWNFPGNGWTGDIWGITVTPWNTIPPVPTFPMPEVAAALATGGAAIGLAGALMLFVAGDAEVVQVTDEQGHQLLVGDALNVDPKTMLTGVRPMPALGGLGQKSVPVFVSSRRDPLTHTVRGKAGGKYTLTSIGGGVAATLRDVPTANGAADIVSLAQGAVDFTASVQKPIALTLLGVGNSKRPRSATLKTTLSANAAARLSFDAKREAFEYVHKGPDTTYALELASYSDKGERLAHSASPAPIAQGDTLTITPDWKTLSGGVLSVRSVGGSVTNRPLS